MAHQYIRVNPRHNTIRVILLSKWPWLLFLFSAVAIFISANFLPVFASPPGSVYYAGETLNPDCDPDDDNCTVAAPITTIFSATTTVTMGNYDLNFDSGTLYIDAVNNRVGIGTTTPSAKLTVVGGNIMVADGNTSTTISKNNLIVAAASGYNLGLFYVDASGNVSASGTITTATSLVTPSITLDGSTRTSWPSSGANDWGRFASAWGEKALMTSTTFPVQVDNTLYANGILTGSSTVGSLVVTSTLSFPTNSIIDAMLADNITASNYLPLAGGTMTGVINAWPGALMGSSTIGLLEVTSSLMLGRADNYTYGKFYVDSSGNVSASGTYYAFGDTVLGDASGDIVTINGTPTFLSQTKVCNGSCGSPGVATAAGDLYIEDAIEADGNLNVGGTGTFGGQISSVGVVQPFYFSQGTSDYYYLNMTGPQLLQLGSAPLYQTQDNATGAGETIFEHDIGARPGNNGAVLGWFKAFGVNTWGSNDGPIDLAWATSPDGSITPVERLRITSAGFIGIGTSYPTNKLTVVGNIEAGNGTATSTLAPTFLAINTSTANMLGIFYVDSSGNVSASGTLNLSATSVTSTIAGGLTLETSGLVYDWYTNRVGIGTASPLTALNISGTRPFFTISDANAGTDRKNWYLSSQGGNFYIGTSTDANASATSTYLSIKDMGDISFGNDGLYYEATTSITYINNLETGAMSFDDDAGIINWINLPIVGTTAGLEMSYAAQVDENDILVLYGKTDGAGGVSNIGVGVGTSSPYAILDVMHKFTVASNTGDVSTSGTIYLYGTGTSTFTGGLSVKALNITSNSVTSTFANGIELSGGCFRMPNGTCVSVSGGGGGSGTVNSGRTGFVAYYATDGTAVSEYTKIDLSDSLFHFGNGTATTTIGANFLSVASTTADKLGKFYIDSSGNISASGTLNLSATGVTSTIAGGLTLETSGLVYDWYTNRVGIGTASPLTALNISGTRPFFTISDANAGTDKKNWYLSSQGGNFYIGTSTDANTSATSTYFTIKDMGDVSFGNDGLLYEASSTITYLNSFETGNMNFYDDAGLVSWVNMPITTTTAGIVMSYSAQMDDNDLLVLYGKTDGSGGATNVGVAVGTSTPWAIFDVMNKFTVASNTGDVFASGSLKVYGNVTSTGIAYAPSFQASNASATSTFAGGLAVETSGLVYDWQTNRVGIGTASPEAKLHIYENGDSLGLMVGDSTLSAVDNLAAFRMSTWSDGNAYFDTKTYSGGILVFRIGEGTQYGSQTTWMAVDATNGNIGIGDRTPANKLTVVGNIGVGNGTVTSTLGANYLAIATSTANRLGLFYVDSSGNVSASGSIYTFGNVTSTGIAYAPSFQASNASATSTFAGGLTIETSGLVYDWYSNKVGIGTASPLTALNISGVRPFLTISDSNAGTDRKNWFLSSQGGNFYIGTSTDANPSATSTYLSIKDMGDISFGNDGLYYEATTTITYINSLETGNLNFDNDAGMVSWIDMDVTSLSASDTLHSYTAFMDGNPMLMIWGASDSAGYTSSTGISIATSTTSTYKLYIDGGSMYNPGLGVNGYVRATGFVTATGTLDLAESYPIDPDCADKGTCPMPGDVVCAVESPTTTFVVEKCSASYGESLLGIVSTQPGFVLGDYDFKAGVLGVDYRVIALSGRVPLRVSTANGPIKKGDYLTSSNVPGVAMRATEPGRVVGVALQDFGDDKISDIGNQILDIGVTEGMVLTFVNPHWSIGSMNIEEISDEMPAEFGLLDRFTLAVKNSLRKLGLVIQDGIAKVKSLHTDELCVGGTCVDEAKLKELLERNSLSGSTSVPTESVPVEPVVASTSVNILTTESGGASTPL